ncbi:DUF1593 domain-containing protein, partial [Fulvivirgaceae bacterium BMA10]|nr:DUF1593 domain-containing protein [Fulvivirgaceae bacterium BMA10]
NTVSAPDNLLASAVASDQIDLTWNHSGNNETGFEIERSTEPGTGFILIATVGANVLSHSDAGLLENTTYYYRVRAIGTGTPSAYSIETNATTLAAGTTPDIWLEAECATVGSNWLLLQDPDASGDEYLTIKNRNPFYSSAPTDAANHIQFNFQTNETGNYKVWARVIAGTNSDDSFWVRMDNGQWIKWNNIALGSSWHWDEVHDSNNGNQVVNFNLDPGSHTLEIAFRETKTQIDKLYITSDVDEPTGLGASSINCAAIVIPNAPDNLTANAITSSQIDLAWTHSGGNATSYELERSTTSGSGFTLIATLGSNVLSYSDTGLLDNTTYYYQVRAINSDMVSLYSTEANASTLINVITAPDNLTANAITSDQIDLTWTHSGGNATGYELERSATFGSGFALIATLGSDISSYSDTGLLENTTYYYQIRAINSDTVSIYSNETNATTLINVITAPDNLTANAITSSQIDLAWTHSGENTTSYELERSTASGSGFSLIATLGSDVLSYSDTGLLENTTYYYQIRAINGDTVSLYSTETNATTLINVITAPDDLTAGVASPNQIDLTWTHSGTNTTSFEVERSTASGSGFTLLATVGSGVQSYSDTGLSDNTTYHYQIRAINNDTASAYSNEACATTAINVIAAPENLTVNAVSTNQIDLTWTHHDTNATSFELERSTASGSGFTLIATLGSDILSYSDTGLLENTTYYYQIRAINNDTVSVYSNEANATTLISSIGDIWLEAECGTVGSKWKTLSDPQSSNASYTEVLNGNNAYSAPMTTPDGRVRLTFNVAEPGIYTLWGRVIAPNSSDDSFWISMDGGAWVKWNGLSTVTNWDWKQVTDYDNQNQTTSYDLAFGAHYIDIAFREDGAQLDKLYLTNSGNIPTGTGMDGINCSSSAPLPFVTVTTSDANAYEKGQDQATFTISRDQTSGSTTVDYEIVGDINGSDILESLSGSVTIPDGSSSVDIHVTPNDDIDIEGAELITVRLQGNTGYFLEDDHESSAIIYEDEIDFDQQEKARVIILTDVGPPPGSDPDDLQSLVRALIYTDQYDLEGIIVTTSYWTTEYQNFGQQIDMGPATTILQAYEDDHANLSQHISGLIDPSNVWSMFKKGNDDVDNDDIIGMDDVGVGLNNPGSDHIISVVDAANTRPVHVLIWGGANTLAQTLIDVAATRTEDEVNAFVKKLVVHESSGQDDAGAYIAKNFPTIKWIRNVYQHRAMSYIVNPANELPEQGGVNNFNFDWIQDNVKGHGNLGAVYPEQSNGTNEGDSPTLLWAFRNGLNGYMMNSWGSWGGRFSDVKQFGDANSTLPPRAGWHPIRNKEAYLAPFSMFTEVSDTWYWEEGNITYTDNTLAPLFRWREQYQNDFEARMDWASTSNYADANHNPIAVVNNDNTQDVLLIKAGTNNTVILSALGSSDPDSDQLFYSWWVYEEAGNYSGFDVLDQKITNADQVEASFTVPSDASIGDRIHIILTVKDNGAPALFTNRRIIIEVDAGSIISGNVIDASSQNQTASHEILGQQATKEHITIFPQPSKDFVTVDFGKNIDHGYLWRLVDQRGVKFDGGKVNAKSRSFVIDVQNLQSGMYYLLLDGKTTKKEKIRVVH